MTSHFPKPALRRWQSLALACALLPLAAAAQDGQPQAATEATAQANAAWLERLPFADRQDFEDARRGLVARLPEQPIRTADGRVAWNPGAYAFQRDEAAPATVNPSL